MATEIKVPAILIPGIGSYIALTNAIYDETLKKSQSEINASISQVEGLIDQINGLTGGTVQQASDINVQEIQGLTAKSAQAALEELMSIKADKVSAVFHTALQETVPVVEKLVADIANIAYADAQGHDLVKLHESVQTLSRDITRLKTRVDQDENNYLSKNLQSDAVIFYDNVEIARLSKEFTNFLNLRSNGSPVWTEVQGREIEETVSRLVKNILFGFQKNSVNVSVQHLNPELDTETDLPCASEKAAGFMSADDKKALNASVESVEISQSEDSVYIEVKNNSGSIKYPSIPAATSEMAGVMSAGDKDKLDNLVINDLTTGGADKALSAEMGKEIKNYLEENKPVLVKPAEKELMEKEGTWEAFLKSNIFVCVIEE